MSIRGLKSDDLFIDLQKQLPQHRTTMFVKPTKPMITAALKHAAWRVMGRRGFRTN